MIVIVFLAIAQLSSAALMRNIMDPQIIEIGDIGGFLDDDYEDPLLMQPQLPSIGAMPIFRLLESPKIRGNSLDNIPAKVKTAEAKKVIDEALTRLELTRAKLEKGNTNISTDIEKVIQTLKTLQKSARPDIRRVLNSLQSIMTMARPINISELKEIITTGEPESSEKIGVLEKPQNFDRQALNVRVISDDKPKPTEKPESNYSQGSSQSMSAEKSSEEDKATEDAKPLITSEKPKESYEATKPPFEFKIKEKKNRNFDSEDVMSSYKLTWKAAGIV